MWQCTRQLVSRVRVRVRTIFERRSGDRTRVDGVCDFEKVPPDQLCPSAKRDKQVHATECGSMYEGVNATTRTRTAYLVVSCDTRQVRTTVIRS